MPAWAMPFWGKINCPKNYTHLNNDSDASITVWKFYDPKHSWSMTLLFLWVMFWRWLSRSNHILLEINQNQLTFNEIQLGILQGRNQLLLQCVCKLNIRTSVQSPIYLIKLQLFTALSGYSNAAAEANSTVFLIFFYRYNFVGWLYSV